MIFSKSSRLWLAFVLIFCQTNAHGLPELEKDGIVNRILIAENKGIYLGNVSNIAIGRQGGLSAGPIVEGQCGRAAQYPGQGEAIEEEADRKEERHRAAEIVWRLARGVRGGDQG